MDWQGIEIENPSIVSHKSNSHLFDNVNVIGNGDNDHDYITCYDPSTGQHIDTLVADNKSDIKEKINLAKVSQLKWKSSTFDRRLRVLKSLLNWVVNDIDNLVDVACRDTGKTSKVFILIIWNVFNQNSYIYRG